MSKKQELVALAKTINGFKGENSDAYGRVVPDLAISELGAVENFTALSNIMLNSGYAKLQNEFVSSLLNRIGLSMIQATSSANPLSIFKKGALPYGTDVEVIFTNPATAEDIGAVSDANMSKLLKTYKPDTKVVYLRTNRGQDGLGDVYAVTVTSEDLKRAFQSIETLDSYVTSLVRSLTAGDENDEFAYAKKIVDNAVNENYVVIEAIATDITSEASLKAFVAKLRSRYLKFTLPSVKNNAYTHFPDSAGNPAKVNSRPDEIALIIKSDILANVDVAVLAAAFNMEKTDFLGRVIAVDEFENAGIQAVLCDMSWLQIYDSEKTIEDFRNARTGTTNTFLRARGTFAILPFANAVAFVLDDAEYLPSIPATVIVPAKTAVALNEVVNFRLTPTNSTELVQLKSTSTATVEIDNVAKTFKKTSAGTVVLEIVGTPAVNVTITAA